MKAIKRSLEAIPVKDATISFKKAVRKDIWLYGMMLPGLIYYLLFKYLPMWDMLIAFKDYQPALGFWGSRWVGMEHFERFFRSRSFGSCFGIQRYWRYTTSCYFSRYQSLLL